MKSCTKCGSEKPLDAFYSDRSRKDGHTARCKPCVLESQRDYYARNREAKLEHARRWREANPEQHTENWRRSVLKHQFGITLEYYNELLERQGHCCALCGRHESEFKKRLAVDHCHREGVVRALLCGGCNTGLGNFART